MIEQQQTTPSDIREIFNIAGRVAKWTWISFLSILLLASILLRTSGKITALLLIFLAAATVLPRRYRKWFWVVTGWTIVILTIWVFLPEDSDGWLPYRFEAELATLEARREIPDSENAAVLYNALLAEQDSVSFIAGLPDGELDTLPMRELWLETERPEIAEWLRTHRGTIDSLLKTVKIKQCQFPIRIEVRRIDDIMKCSVMMRQWAYLLILAANNDLAKERTSPAIEKYLAALQIGKHQYQQPSLLDFMVGVGIESFATSQLKELIVTSATTEEQLNLIEESMAGMKHEWQTNMPDNLDYQKLLSKNFWGSFYEINPQGKIRICRQLPAGLRAKNVPPTYWGEKRNKFKTIFYWFYIPSSPQKAGEIIDSAFERYYKMVDADFDWKKSNEDFSFYPIRLNCCYLIEMQLDTLETVYHSMHYAYLKTVAQQRGARIAIALKHYKNKNGNWPASLDEVRSLAAEEIFTDPTNDSSFIYKLIDKEFTLYSKGKDNKDEGCRYGSDDWSIWPPMEL